MCAVVWYARCGSVYAAASARSTSGATVSGWCRQANTASRDTPVLSGAMPLPPRTPPRVLRPPPPPQIPHQRMLDTIRPGFQRFGYLRVETPAFELTEVLLTKSGGETEKQVYYVQSTGALKQGDVPELALRFDLTVPLARYVAQHEHQLNFPFRR